MEILNKAKLTIKDLGSPKNPPEDGSLKKLGRIVGIVSKTKTVVDARGQAFTALVGQFAGVTADGSTMIRSGVVYLPGGFQDEILSAWMEANKPDENGVQPPASSVKFAYDAFSRAATNPIGYEYIFRSLMPPAKLDPIADLIGGNQIAALASSPAIAPPAETPEETGDHHAGEHKAKAKAKAA